MIRKTSIAIGLVALVIDSAPLLASEYAADFLYLGTGADAAGMAGAWSTSKAGATSFYWNPALILDEQHLKAYAEGVTLFSGLSSYQSAALQWRLKEHWALSGGLQMNLVDGIPRFGELTEGRDLNNPDDRSSGLESGSSFSDQSMALTIGLSREFWFDILLGQGLLRNSLPARFAIGSSWRILREELDGATASGGGLDLGVKLIVTSPSTVSHKGQKELVFSLARQNLASMDMAWDTDSSHEDPLPANTRFGLSYKDRWERLSLDWRLALEHDKVYAGTWRTGTELTWLSRFQLRAGVAGESFSGADPSFGAGIKLKNLVFSYAFSDHDLGASHRVSVEFRR